MIQIGNFFGSILGYLLWPLYFLFKNYGVAIIIFTIVVKLLMFPFSVKQQKSMAGNAKLQAKQKELQEKYSDNKEKLNQEIQKLYEKEGVNPMGGCLPMLIPFPIMIGIYYTVINPISNVLHISSAAVQQAAAMLQQLPGIGSMFSNSFYAEMQIIQHYNELRPHLDVANGGMFTADELSQIDFLSSGFDFLGLNLLGTPQGSPLSTMLWLIPVLCLVSSLGTQFITMKLQPGMQQQQGCMKLMLYGMPLFSAWLAYTLPGAVGFYWTISTLTSLLQTLITHKFYSPAQLVAKSEAQRIALREQEEAAVKPLPPHEQQKLAAQREARIAAQQKKKAAEAKTAEQPAQKKTSGQKPKGGNSSKGNVNDYLGSKK